MLRASVLLVGVHATVVGGEVLFRDGVHTGALPRTMLTNGARRGTGPG